MKLVLTSHLCLRQSQRTQQTCMAAASSRSLLACTCFTQTSLATGESLKSNLQSSKISDTGKKASQTEAQSLKGFNEAEM